MKNIFLFSSLILCCISCTNANKNLENIKNQEFTRKSTTLQNKIKITGETSKSFINLYINNTSNKTAFIELGNAKIIRNNNNFKGLYNISNTNNSYYKDQTVIVKPHSTYSSKFAIKQDLQFKENTSVEEFLSPKAWGINNEIDNNKISSIIIPVSIEKFDENIKNFHLNFKF